MDVVGLRGGGGGVKGLVRKGVYWVDAHPLSEEPTKIPNKDRK